MLVKSIMLSVDKLTTISSTISIGQAMKIMEKNRFLSIPVVDGSEFKGAISRNAIYEFYFNNGEDKKSLLEDYQVAHLLRKDIPIINAEEHLEGAVAFLEKMNISFVAVVDDFNEFKGIITHHGVFEQFTNVFGLNKGDRLAVMAFDVPGQISKLSKILTENYADIISFVVVDPKSVTDVREIVVRMRTEKLDEIEIKVREAGFKVL
ncbi:CBS domain-containing protein [Clostridium cavendishii DSM 21758]|uniref:CBS domain-containing protein n=1 Tax=Clostridium cavendishii DSM 21758 TaxID=1121302 RepID=A0A1M6UEN5_9CLOT|nr:CBS domain-containing protein [Clostridium cavendishii]SHK67518.1 CBS domain-containing protein [Clostridium cavendishii DSM 21758]